MKTTFLLFSGLILSVASFAQTSVKTSNTTSENSGIQSDKSGSQVNNSAGISSATNIKSDATNNIKSRSSAEVKKEKKAIANEKRRLSAKAEDAGKSALTDGTVSASAHSEINAQSEHNNLSKDASLNGSGTVSNTSLNDELKLKKQAKSNVKSHADATIETTSRVKANVNKTAIKAGNEINAITTGSVHAGAAAAQPVRVKPASIKLGTAVKTNGGMKIR